MEKELESQNEVGVGPNPIIALDPRQSKFIDLYFDCNSKTFGNCYQSAMKAGYTTETARNLTHNRPKWLSEKLGQMPTLEPELLLLKLTTIINNGRENTHNQLRAIDMMMRHYQMFGRPIQGSLQINIEDLIGA